VPYGSGRDPRGIGDVLGNLTSEMGWESPIARAEVLARWPEIVGAETAAHAVPAGIEGHVLTVRCDSTAWATQLRRMNAAITTKIIAGFEAAGIESVKFLGPDTPSWKRGPRAIPGRGPRDTYG
jgi:predicted nucleic acid-binding Zn ribbon protein